MSKNRNVISMIQDETLFTTTDIEYLMYNIENKEDLLVLNHVQTSVINKFGKGFLQQSKDKIEFVLQLLLDDNPNALYDFYNFTSNHYLSNQTGVKDIAPFNLIFLTYVHFAMKVLRSNS